MKKYELSKNETPIRQDNDADADKLLEFIVTANCILNQDRYYLVTAYSYNNFKLQHSIRFAVKKPNGDILYDGAILGDKLEYLLKQADSKYESILSGWY